MKKMQEGSPFHEHSCAWHMAISQYKWSLVISQEMTQLQCGVIKLSLSLNSIATLASCMPYDSQHICTFIRWMTIWNRCLCWYVLNIRVSYYIRI